MLLDRTRLVEQKGGLDSVQLTGGEAMLHPEFWEMLAFVNGMDGVKRIYIPTNGILLARRACAERLVAFKDKTMVLLQFDGRDVATNKPLRDANTLAIRQRVIENLAELQVYMQLTMTVARGVNEADVGWVVDTALRHSVVKVAALQPVTYSGRYDLPPDPMNRLTLSDVVKAIVMQARKQMTEDEFLPIPCSHPNCGWVTLSARRFGLTVNIANHIDLARAMDRVAYKTILSTDELRGVVGNRSSSLRQRATALLGRKLIRARDGVGIAIKPFMDRFTYDQDRISACCHHTLDTHGNAVSFCEYNARLRPGDSWEEFPRMPG
ncbi:MAG: 7,8-dihydro-6-hydroxymethylpterin dimethyltransferase [Phycisphaerales bacterium]|nr:7,8-dihydro-6-hydroxymethylpterin dimethyltransferase [Phycisphaerales bacterium]